MTFEEFCKKHKVTEEEREELMLFLMAKHILRARKLLMALWKVD